MRVRNILVTLVLILIVGGLGVKAISNVRNLAYRTQCQNNLKQIGLALHDYQVTYHYFPSATVPNPTLPAERRLSWITEIYPTFMVGGVKSLLDSTRPWDDDTNYPPRVSVRIDTRSGATKEMPMTGNLRGFLCPANLSKGDPSLPSPTHYIGISGLGENAAELPLSDPRVGFFGYERKLSVTNIKKGTSVTMVVTEVLDGGPWTAGGTATVRGVLAGDRPYVGRGGQFESQHWSGGVNAFSRPALVNVLFADNSVRPIESPVSPEVLEAFATIAGVED